MYQFRTDRGVNCLTAIITDVKYRMSLSIIRDLGEAGVRIISCHTDTQDGSPPLGFYSKYTSERHIIPPDGFEDALFELCESITETDGGRRPALLPVGASTLSLLSKPATKQRFSDVSGLFIPTAEQLELLNDKVRVSELATLLDINIPVSYSPADGEPLDLFFERAPVPCVVKPRWGEGLGLTAALRYAIARTPEELKQSYNAFSELAGESPIVQEYLPGHARGCSVIAQNGAIINKICHRRIREYPVSGGPSTCCETIRDPQLDDWCGHLTDAVGLNGLAMFEFKDGVDGLPRLLEVNPRVWGSYPLTRIAKTGFSYSWFVTSYNAGNPDKPIPYPPETEYHSRRMVFFPSDIAAAAGYLRAGKPGPALGAVGDIFRPGSRDGLFEWRDARPALHYWSSLIK